MDNSYQYTNYTTEQQNTFRLIKLAVIALIVIVLVVLGVMFYQSRKFHVVRTNPDMSNVAAIAPFIKFDFNQPVKIDKTMSITASPDIINSFEAKDKTLTVDLADGLEVGQKYSITLGEIDSTTGETVRNKIYTFTAQDIAFNDLPADQQQAIIKSQDNAPISRDSYNYNNINILTDNGGLTIYQSDDIKQALFQYFQKNKLKVSEIDFSNFTPPAPHPDQPAAPDISSVDVSFNGNIYTAKIAALDLESIKLTLLDSNNHQIYDSGKVDTYANN